MQWNWGGWSEIAALIGRIFSYQYEQEEKLSESSTITHSEQVALHHLLS